MYIHIGGEYVISDKYIIGIFDFDRTTVQMSDTIGFLKHAEQAGRIETVSPELPRSFVVTLDRIYVTPISTMTLRRRLDRREADDPAASREDPEKNNWQHPLPWQVNS